MKKAPQRGDRDDRSGRIAVVRASAGLTSPFHGIRAALSPAVSDVILRKASQTTEGDDRSTRCRPHHPLAQCMDPEAQGALLPFRRCRSETGIGRISSDATVGLRRSYGLTPNALARRHAAPVASTSREPAFVLVHSPLVGPTSWLPVARELERRGRVAVVPLLLGVAEAPEPRWRGAHRSRPHGPAIPRVRRPPLQLALPAPLRGDRRAPHQAPGRLSQSAPSSPRCDHRKKASRSALIVSAWVVGRPCGNPSYVLSVPFCTSSTDSGAESL